MRRILHHFPLCGFSRAIRIILSEKHLDFALEYEHPWSVSDEVLEHNPVGSLPVLIDLNGSAISGTHALIEYIEEMYPDVNLLGTDVFQKTESRRIVDWFCNFFYKEVYFSIVNEKFLKRFSKTTATIDRTPNQAALRLASSSISKHLEYIAWLSDRRNWLAGQTFSVADIYAASMLSVLDYLGCIPWDKHPVTKMWYMRIKSRPSFKSILSDNLSFIPPSKDYSNLDF